MKLWIQAIAASLSGLVFFGVFLFGPAGTFRYGRPGFSSRSSQ
jgi:hypothetical protein